MRRTKAHIRQAILDRLDGYKEGRRACYWTHPITGKRHLHDAPRLAWYRQAIKGARGALRRLEVEEFKRQRKVYRANSQWLLNRHWPGVKRCPIPTNSRHDEKMNKALDAEADRQVNKLADGFIKKRGGDGGK